MVQTPFTAELAAGLGGPEWLRRRRTDAFDAFAASAMPSASEEVWRYSRIDDLDLALYSPAALAQAITGHNGAGSVAGAWSSAGSYGEARALPDEVAAVVASLGARSALVQVVNGQIVSVEAGGSVNRGLVRVRSANDPAQGGPGNGAPDDPGSGVQAPGEQAPGEQVAELLRGASGGGALDFLADAFMADAVIIEIAAGAVVEDPVVIVQLVMPSPAGSLGVASFPVTILRSGANSEAKVVELFFSAGEAPGATGSAGAAGSAGRLVVPRAQIELADGAHLSYLGAQELPGGTWCIGSQRSVVGRDATLTSYFAALGGYYSRLDSRSTLAGQGGTANLLASYLGTGDQMHDFRTLQEHAAPKTTSDLLFKGAVGDAARSVYSGLIRVRKGAAGTNAFQTNRNLVLSEGAHADSVPNLEIEENDVRCSHASAVGPIDEEQRYYLESRGVSPGLANRLIVLGFFDDILSRSPVGAARAHLTEQVSSKVTALREVG
ncbi:MAG: SufB/SufD family protein [Acidimicrobiales bacterium]